MITYSDQDIWTTTADMMIIPVNCYGVCGAGLAKQWANRYPEDMKVYRRYAKRFGIGILKPGVLYQFPFIHYNGDKKISIRLITTKDHWRNPSKLEWIASALVNLRDHVYSRQQLQHQFPSVALPKIGCGLGGLHWENDVEPLVKFCLENTNIIIYG